MLTSLHSVSCFRVTTPLRDYTKIERKNCQLVKHYGGKNFRSPQDVTIGPNDEVVIADRFNKEVIIFDKDLKLIRTFGQGSGDSKLNGPVGIAVSHNVIAVSEFNDHVVKKFSLQGDYLSEFGSHGSGDGQFYRPQGLCFNSKGLLYVVDNLNYRVQVFRENAFLFKFGSKGHNPGQFQSPRYIAVDSSDQVYVTDQCDDGGIKVFDSSDQVYVTDQCDDGGISVFGEDGHFIKRITSNQSFIICITPDDHILATVNGHDSIAVFSPTHEHIGKFGMRGEGKGQFTSITGIAINNSGTIFVIEYGNTRLQVIRI